MLFLLPLHSRRSTASVVFDFNAPLSDAAPGAPISLPVYFMRKGRIEFVDGCNLCVVSFVFTTQIEFCKCCV